MKLRTAVVPFLLLLAGGPAGAVNLDELRLPPGFRASIYTDAVPDARQIARSPNGVLFVGTRKDGKVYAAVDEDQDGTADRVHVIAEDLFLPSGVAFRDGALYVAEVNRILRFDGIEAHLEDPSPPVVVYDKLPGEAHHGWKFIAFGPDGKLYVPVGAPCNVCARPEPFGTLLQMNPDGSDVQVYARGIRNSVGFAWHPRTHELWFTDNGRDWLGDDQPACELNRVTEPGQHFGFPYVHGGDIPDPDFGSGKDPADYVGPVQKLGPHVAPLGLLFYTGRQFPADYRGAVLIAEHGSWNRTEKIGYRIMKVVLADDGSAASYEPFITGWLTGDRAWGRPVDLLQLPDGAILISDDQAGAVYRVSYTGEQ